MLLLRQGLCQWVCDIVISRYSANLHISSLNNFSDQMESSEYMLGSLVRPWFLSLSDGTIVITIEFNRIGNAWDHFKFLNELLDPNRLFGRIK